MDALYLSSHFSDTSKQSMSAAVQAEYNASEQLIFNICA